MVWKTDRDWEILGRTDPYWAVVTHDEYRRENLTDEAVEEFFESGERYLEVVLERIRSTLDPEFAPRTALDFGCGVGRVLVHLAKRCESVVGIDVAESMLMETRARCDSLGLANVSLLKGDDSLSGVSGSYDLVHSFIVLQHIPPSRGMGLVTRLAGLLAPEGVGVLHLTYARRGGGRAHPARCWAGWMKQRAVHFVRRAGGSLVPGLRRRIGSTAAAPMYVFHYDLNTVFRVLQEASIRRLHVEHTDHSGCYGVILFFQRVLGAGYAA
jgi:2-polyprenyl-3-methyl-5-hydroxy-6-metoxy-1,4-benzoquinol methylase